MELTESEVVPSGRGRAHTLVTIVLLHLVLLAAMIWLIAEVTPSIRIDGYASAAMIAFIYGLVNTAVGEVLALAALPFEMLLEGLLLMPVNLCLLWLTDRWSPRFEVTGINALLMLAVLISVTDSTLTWVLGIAFPPG